MFSEVQWCLLLLLLKLQSVCGIYVALAMNSPGHLCLKMTSDIYPKESQESVFIMFIDLVDMEIPQMCGESPLSGCKP